MFDTWLKQRRELFWDINENDIAQAFSESKEWVILRVFDYGSIEDISELIQFYGEQDVKKVLIAEKLSRVTKVMAFMFLDVKKEENVA